MNNKPEVIKGGKYNDHRGNLFFFNDLDLNQVRRMYVIEHTNSKVIRAWQGHKIEQKWFYVIEGSFKLLVVKPDDWADPSAELESTEFIMQAGQNAILHLPGGYANGFQAIQSPAKMIVFSDLTIEESASDNYRFDQNLWYDWGK